MRIKQWLAMLRSTHAQGEQLFDKARVYSDLAEIKNLLKESSTL
jgi:hypothetical protein